MCVVLRTRKDSCDDTRSQCMFETESVSQKLIKEMGTHGDRDQSKLCSAQFSLELTTIKRLGFQIKSSV